MKDILIIAAFISLIILAIIGTNQIGKECGMTNALLFSKYTQMMYMLGECEDGHIK